MSGSSAADVRDHRQDDAAGACDSRLPRENITIGTLAGAGTLGLLIPPSIIMIVYGVTAEVSITRLFIAGVIPGLLLAALFMAYTSCGRSSTRTRCPPPDQTMTFGEKVYASRHLMPVVALIALVLGSIYVGIATATEAAALGVVGALVDPLKCRDRCGARVRLTTLMGATRLYCMIALILAGASFLTLSMGYIGLPRHLAEWIGGFGMSQFWLIVGLIVFYIILGCFLDGISMVVLTMGVILPTIQKAGIDLLWFGIFHRAGRGDGADHAAGRLQPLRAARHDRPDITWIARNTVPMFVLMVAAVLLIWVRARTSSRASAAADETRIERTRFPARQAAHAVRRARPAKQRATRSRA